MNQDGDGFQDGTPRMDLDEDGIPVLREVVIPGPRGPGTAARELPDPMPALDDSALDGLIDDIAADLQTELSWKIEAILADTLRQVLHQAVEQGGPQFLDSIRTQLRVALPELLATTARRRPDA